MDKGEIMGTIKETTLHPDGNEGVDLYPKTNINQVQELPQKLTSVENQINQLNIDKLTKPANPSAESAVVIGTDGTVSTKALSELGASKLYIHNVVLNANEFGNTSSKAYFSIYMTTIDTITLQLLTDIAGGIQKYYYIQGYIKDSANSYTYSVRLNTQGPYLSVGVISSDGNSINEPVLFSDVDSDTVYEL